MFGMAFATGDAGPYMIIRSGSNTKPVVIVVPGILGTKLAAPDEVVWLSDQSIFDALGTDSRALASLGRVAYKAYGVPDDQNPLATGPMFNLDPTTIGGDKKFQLTCDFLKTIVQLGKGFKSHCSQNINVYNDLFSDLSTSGYSPSSSHMIGAEILLQSAKIFTAAFRLLELKRRAGRSRSWLTAWAAW